MDYESARNTTLLYFFEYLMKKGEFQRFRHLACLFGAKDFTKEMKEIAGGSAAGLKKLLSAHPSLFTIVDDELVYINTYGSNLAFDISKCGETQKAKDFFKKKLQTYGKGAKVPIISLQGHRSQALQEVRHVVGRTVRDLTDFLSKHPETFRIIGDNVLLLESDVADVAHTSKSKYTTYTPTDWKVKLETLCEKNWPKLCPVQLSSVPDAENQTHHLTRMLSSLNYFTDDEWKAKVLEHAQVISTVADSLLMTNEILNSVGITGDQAVVSVNCKEGHSDEIHIALIGIGMSSGQALLFDVLTCPQIMTEGGLQSFLENNKVIKLMHDCRYDSEKLYMQFQTILTNVFDTQSAYAILQHQVDGTQLIGANRSSLSQLVTLYYTPYNPMTEQLSKRSSWNLRPLTQEMVIGAARDVLVLVDEQLYGSLALSIKQENKSLLSAICAEQVLSLIRPGEVKERRMRRRSGREIVELKLKLAETSETVVLTNQEIKHLGAVGLTVDDKSRLCGNRKLARKLGHLEGIGEDKLITKSNAGELEFTNLSTVPGSEPSNVSECVNEFLPKKSSDHFTKSTTDLFAVNQKECGLDVPSTSANTFGNRSVTFADASLRTVTLESNFPEVVMSGEKQAFSLPDSDKSFAVDDSKAPRTKCLSCKHYYVDQDSQTLSTGDIKILEYYVDTIEQPQARK